MEAFQRLQIPKESQEKYNYLEVTKDLKDKVLGLNAAKLFKVNVDEKRKDLPKDYLNQIKMAYLEEGPFPSHHAYGWITNF